MQHGATERGGCQCLGSRRGYLHSTYDLSSLIGVVVSARRTGAERRSFTSYQSLTLALKKSWHGAFSRTNKCPETPQIQFLSMCHHCRIIPTAGPWRRILVRMYTVTAGWPGPSMHMYMYSFHLNLHVPIVFPNEQVDPPHK